jgi:hypothetical protein
MTGLTKEEIDLVENLGKLYGDFLALPNRHPMDAGEFANQIHILQRQVMARLARRTHPDIFPITNDNQSDPS